MAMATRFWPSCRRSNRPITIYFFPSLECGTIQYQFVINRYRCMHLERPNYIRWTTLHSFGIVTSVAWLRCRNKFAVLRVAALRTGEHLLHHDAGSRVLRSLDLALGMWFPMVTRRARYCAEADDRNRSAAGGDGRAAWELA